MQFNHAVSNKVSSQAFVRAWPTLPAGEIDIVESEIEPLPGTSMSEDGGYLYIEAALPGVDPENIEVTFDQDEDVVWISGKRAELGNENRKYYYKTLGSFSYRVAIPEAVVKSADTRAICKNGLLTVSLTRLPRLLPRKLEVASA
ncbi:MAG: Hsp20/alpha crystallin family protein [Candidatus Doudnabacteria bacterium]|nr:Hsp20/alpha crystallin family protein [Candidatus Doudnabacteria bacterium]